MTRPALLAQPYAHWIADILARFEDGKPLTSDQLNFLISHEKTLSNHALDTVIKYYLNSKKGADKFLSFTIPKNKIQLVKAHEIRDAVENLLKLHLSHIDLQMTLEQFLQLKASGFKELIFWHGPHFLSESSPFSKLTPHILYFQWGKLFGVVKVHGYVPNYQLDANVLIFFEEMDKRSLNQCVLDYVKNHKLDHIITLQNSPTPAPVNETHYHLPSPRPSIYEISKDQE